MGNKGVYNRPINKSNGCVSTTMMMTLHPQLHWGGVRNKQKLNDATTLGPRWDAWMQNWYQYVKMDEKIENQGLEIQKLWEMTTPTLHTSKISISSD